MGAALCKQALNGSSDHSRHTTCSATSPWLDGVELDWNGCRKFDRLPAPGTHPRLFFTEQELPGVIARFNNSEISAALRENLEGTSRNYLNRQDTKFALSLTDEQLEKPSKEIVDQIFKQDEIRNLCMVGAYAYGKIYDYPESVKKVKRAVLIYAKMVVVAREIALEQNVRDKPFDIWHNNRWDVTTGNAVGGASFALLYDLMFNELSKDEQELMRRAIAVSVSGRRGWGMGFPTRRIQSNWAPYHGDLYVMNAAIEDEPGFDREVHSMYSDLMVHFMDYAIYDSGHPVEDGYVLNLALRSGSLCFIAMARRGFNIFNHPRFKQIWTNWVPYALEPNNSGKIYGGASGSMWMYPTSAVVAKFMFPKNEIIDSVYEKFMKENGKPYARLSKVQCRLPVLAFALPALADGETFGEDDDPACGQLPLDFVCRDRGKVVLRSGWRIGSMWMTLDARADGFLIGHDSASRGIFVLNGGGRAWGICPEWNFFNDGTNHSLVQIDGVSEKAKGSFSRIATVISENTYSCATADLTYTYNWMWSNWVNENTDLSAKGFEPEYTSPRDWGYNVWWAPDYIRKERDVGFSGLHVWRKRFNYVERAFRSVSVLRVTRPVAIIVDDVKADDEERMYTWVMAISDDVVVAKHDNRGAVLGEEGDGDRRLAIRHADRGEMEMTCELTKITKENRGRSERVGQVRFSTRATEVRFVVVMVCARAGESVDVETRWDDEDTLSVRDGETDETSKVAFGRDENGHTTMKLLRD